MEQTPQTIEQPEVLLDRLKTLLDEQIDMARTSNLKRLEAAADQTGLIITEIAENPLYKQTRLKARYEEILKTYQKIALMVRTNKDAIQKSMRKVGNGRKVLRTYRPG